MALSVSGSARRHGFADETGARVFVHPDVLDISANAALVANRMRMRSFGDGLFERMDHDATTGMFAIGVVRGDVVRGAFRARRSDQSPESVQEL